MNMEKLRKHVRKREIMLNIDTLNRLERCLLELRNENRSSRISLDEAINTLLDEHEGFHSTLDHTKHLEGFVLNRRREVFEGSRSYEKKHSHRR